MVSFVNALLSYVMVLLVIGVLGAVAVTVGITMAKKKNTASSGTSETADGAGKA